MALRDYNAAVDFVDRNVAEGRGDKTAFIDPSRNLTYARVARCGRPHWPDASSYGHRTRKPDRSCSARYRRLSDPVLGRDPRRHHSDSGQYTADGRSVSLPVRRLARQGGLRFDRAAPGRSGSCDRPAEPQADRRGRRRPRPRCRGSTSSWLPRTKARRRPEHRPTKSPIGSIRPGTTGMPKGTMHVHSTPIGHGAKRRPAPYRLS